VILKATSDTDRLSIMLKDRWVETGLAQNDRYVEVSSTLFATKAKENLAIMLLSKYDDGIKSLIAKTMDRLSKDPNSEKVSNGSFVGWIGVTEYKFRKGVHLPTLFIECIMQNGKRTFRLAYDGNGDSAAVLKEMKDAVKSFDQL
jgi:hypothetical protein